MSEADETGSVLFGDLVAEVAEDVEDVLEEEREEVLETGAGYC